MIQIFIDWHFISPSLKAISGIVKVYNKHVSHTFKDELLAEFQVTKEEGNRGYSSKEGVPTKIMDAIRPQLDSMVDGFWSGMNLSKNIYLWINNEEMEKSLTGLKEIEESTELIYKDENYIRYVSDTHNYKSSP